MDSLYFFYVLVFFVAFLYAAVGHGGASGYLALMAIFGMAPEMMKPTALLLNLFVSLIAFVQFYRGGHFILRIFIPLAAASVPMAFLGGLVEVKAMVYKKILGMLLLIPVARFLFFSNIKVAETRDSNLMLSVSIGAVIGFLSGLIGIGGGIILSPVLLLLKWTDQKQAAAISAAFIFVNSLAGLAGQFTKGIQFNTDMYVFVSVAIGGGILGSYLGAIKFPQAVLKNILALVLMLAAFKLLFTHA
jgi:uncharacterized membrane protein YfcA